MPCIVRNKWCPVSIWQFLRWRHFAACAMQRRQLGIQWFCHVHAVPRQHLSIDGRCYIPVVVSSVSHGYRKFNRVFVMSSGAWRIQVCVRARECVCVCVCLRVRENFDRSPMRASRLLWVVHPFAIVLGFDFRHLSLRVSLLCPCVAFRFVPVNLRMNSVSVRAVSAWSRRPSSPTGFPDGSVLQCERVCVRVRGGGGGGGGCRDVIH